MKSKRTPVIQLDHLDVQRAIGTMFREMRTSACLTAKSAAHLVGLSLPQFLKYESGETSITFARVLQFGAAYGYNSRALLDILFLHTAPVELTIAAKPDGTNHQSLRRTHFEFRAFKGSFDSYPGSEISTDFTSAAVIEDWSG